MNPDPLQTLLAPVWDWIAPPRCAGCDALLPRASDVFCPGCTETTEPLGPAVCPVCSEPGWHDRCRRCRLDPPPFSRARAGFGWGGELAVALRRCKYGGRMELASALGGLLGPLLQRAGERADGVVPVPLSTAGMRRRGFNQVIELLRGARRAGARMPSVWPAVLVKPRDRPAQASLALSARRCLPAAAFSVVRPARVRGRALLLVDDVMTTGATVRACAKALRRAGAARVEVVTLARAG